MTNGSNTRATSVQHQQRQRQRQQQKGEQDYKNLPTEKDIFNSTVFNNSNISDNNNTSASLLTQGNQLQLLGNNNNTTTQQPVNESNCIPDCGPFGTCTNICQYYDITTTFDDTNDNDNGTKNKKKKVCNNQCICDTGYTGVDCSTVHVECNGYIKTIVQRYNTYTRYCYNGGSCVESTTDDTEEVYYDCNCTTAALDKTYNTNYNNNNNDNTFIDNPQCEYEDNIISCQVDEVGDSIVSNYAYCVNGGYCRSIIDTTGTMNHIPCFCPIDYYNGRHCQYTTNTIPTEELVYIQNQIEQFIIQIQNYSQINNNSILSNTNGNGNGTTATNNSSTSFVMRLITIICIIIGIILLRFIYLCIRKRSKSTNRANISSNRKNSRAVANALQDFDTSSDHNNYDNNNNDNDDTISAYNNHTSNNDHDHDNIVISNATMIQGGVSKYSTNDSNENNKNSDTNSNSSNKEYISNTITTKPKTITKTTTMTTEQTTHSSVNDTDNNNDDNGGGVMS